MTEKFDSTSVSQELPRDMLDGVDQWTPCESSMKAECTAFPSQVVSTSSPETLVRHSATNEERESTRRFAG